MSTNPTGQEAVQSAFSANNVRSEFVPATELLSERSRLELPAPSSQEYDLFLKILRSDTKEAPSTRLVNPQTAYDFLLDQLTRAQRVRDRFNNPSRPDVTDTELLQAYASGVDAYAGMLALTSDLVAEDTMAEFQEWSRRATSAVQRADSVRPPRYLLALTPAALAHSQKEQESAHLSLVEVERNERIHAYQKAAETGSIDAIREAFTGTDASRLIRAQALFEYAHHSIPDSHTQLKIDCLSEVVTELKDAVTNSVRPRDDDLVGIYNYFMLQSVLGRAIHDIIMLNDHRTDDDARARSVSIDYLTNAGDALDFVKFQAITAHEQPEEQLRLDILAFNQVVMNDTTLENARRTIDFLSSGLLELRQNQAALLDIQGDPYEYKDKDQHRIVTEKHVEYLAAKATMEQLEAKIEEQHEVIRKRLQVLESEHASIDSRLMALRSEHIGSITPESKGRELAKVVLTIDKQLNDARYFAALYTDEYRAPREQRAKRFADSMARAGILHLLMRELEDISPESDELRAPVLHHPNLKTVAI